MKAYLYVTGLLGALTVQSLAIPLEAQLDRFSSQSQKNDSPNELNNNSDPLDPPAQESLDNSEEEYFGILNFWFGSLSNPAYFPENKLPIWFSETPEIDRQIQESYSQTLIDALNGNFNNWRATPKGRLALILLLDQFSRRLYRGKPQEYMFDPMAKALVLEGIRNGDDRVLYPIERAFFYLPLEHIENLEMQNLAVSLYRQLLQESPPSIKPQVAAFLDYAMLHRDQIARFGRFPHRNVLLERQSTPEEIVFLRQWGRAPFPKS